MLASTSISLQLGAPALATPADDHIRDVAPWVNVNRVFGAAIRTGRIVPVTPNPGWSPNQTLKDGGVYMVSGDLPGWARSIDGGERFESAVSGRPSSKNICGGYGKDWYCAVGPSGKVEEQAWCNTCTAADTDASINREFSEAGPPSSLIAFRGSTASSGRDVSSGPAPAALSDPALQSMCRGPKNQDGCAKDVIYTANDWWSFFSPDAGRQWFRLTPQCEMSQTIGWGAFAADRGLTAGGATKGGHLVGLAMNWDGPGPREASGCALPEDVVLPPGAAKEEKQERLCAERSIAWTDDVGPELAESMKATSLGADAWRGKSRTERAGSGGAELTPDEQADSTDLISDPKIGEWAKTAKWRYSSIRHLPAPAKIGGMCKVYQGPTTNDIPKPGFQASIPSKACKANVASRCHGRRAQTKKQTNNIVADRDAWCLDYKNTDDSCLCTNGPAADCRSPNPTSLEIDPRNGWAYLSTDVGLLSSPSGGQRWIRQGGEPIANPADVFQKMGALDTYTPDKTILGAKLYTKQYHCGTTNDAGCLADPKIENSLDLNANPERIAFVGRVSLAFTPCSTKVTYTGSDRLRGHMVATVPVEWWRNDGVDIANNLKYKRVSSVFMAAQRAECKAELAAPPPAALVFWDTAHLALKPILNGVPNVHPDLDDYALHARTYYDHTQPKLLHNLHTGKGLPLRYTAAAVAPSDPRILWAFSHGYWPIDMSPSTVAPSPMGLQPAALGSAGHLVAFARRRRDLAYRAACHWTLRRKNHASRRRHSLHPCAGTIRCPGQPPQAAAGGHLAICNGLGRRRRMDS